MFNFKKRTLPRRTVGTIKYSIHEIEDKNKVDLNYKAVLFNYDKHGTAIELWVKVDENDDEQEIINKAIRDLLNFDSMVIKDTYK